MTVNESSIVESGAPPPSETPVERSHLDFAVCGIGASAGGIEALMRFFERMPDKAGIAFVVVVHLSPKHESNLDHILQRVTAMPVRRVTERTALEVDHVYVISPSLHLSMNDGHLQTAPAARVRGRPAAVDVFFRTLGEAHRERAISVVLSGTGADGAVGIARVKEYGGVTFVQDPDDAQQAGMPRAAIATGTVDFVMPVSSMPDQMVQLVANATHIRLPIELDPARGPEPISDSAEASEAEEALRGILGEVRLRTRNDFAHYKRGTMLRRIERRMQVHTQPTLPDYLAFLRSHPREVGALVQDLLISVTNFFRDPLAFEALAARLDEVFARRKPLETLRVWVAGCATGEEAYSVAILLHECADKLDPPPAIQVFATDIDERAIAVARAALYPSSIVTDVSPERLRRFFTRERNFYRVNKPLRDTVLFAIHNVLRDPPFSRVDVVCCRNLLIYLERQVQTDVLTTLHFALRPGGLLFLGTSESVDAAPSRFTTFEKRHRIYGMSESQPREFPLRIGTAVGHARLPPPAHSVVAPSPFAQIHRDAVDRNMAPSILLDAEQNILHVSDGASRYLEHRDGAPTNKLVDNLRAELKLELRAALFKASHSGRSVETRTVTLREGDVEKRLNVTVVPVKGVPEEPSYLLILFGDVGETMRVGDASTIDSETQLFTQFEEEVRRLRQHLQETIEDAETSTEEMKASNEELQAINEELRSATEELETSKEELQSMNEELITVNFELKIKVDETANVNDDLRNLIAATGIATIFVDNELRIKRFTPRASELFNLIASDVGRPLLDINHRLDYDELADDLAHAFDALKTTERHIDGHGGRRFLSRVLPYRTLDDKIEGAVLTFIDITALHEAEERARVNEERVRIAAETTRDYAIMTTDEAGIVTTWNAGAERVFGWSELEIVGQSSDLIFTPDDRANGVPQQERGTAVLAGRAEDERWHLRKDGTRIFLSGVMTRYESDSLRGFAKIARDVTNVKKEQTGRDEALKREQGERVRIEAANRLKDEFLAVMSHELKHPLNLILVNAELLTRLPGASGEPSVARAVDIIRKAVLGQGKIIDDLLDLSRMTTGKLALDLAPIDIDTIVETIVGSMADEVVRKGLALNVVIEPGLDLVLADPVRVEQIVFNLLSNASKFTDAGSIDVGLERDGAFARLTVTDTGKGIEREFLPRVFEMFVQDRRRPSREQGGLGIGLALVLQLALAHGGRVEATSDGIGKGSTFRVWLPFDRGQKKREQEPWEAARALDGLRMLVVDDSHDSLEPFVQLLRLEGAAPTGVTSARAALKALDESDHDVVISDLAMPDMDGFALIAEIRRREKTKHIVAIALSGYSRDKDHKQALRAGFDAHIGKPASIVDVRRVVTEARAKT